jgi:hypothetical protein
MTSLIKYIFFILIIIFGFTNFSLAAQWQHSVSHNGIAYFAFSSPRTIERFDMGSETWLEPLTCLNRQIMTV